MSADWWIEPPGYDPQIEDDHELTVASCPTCSMVVDGYPHDAMPYRLPFTFAQALNLSDGGRGGHRWNVTYNLSRMLAEAGFMGWGASGEHLTDTTVAAQHFATVLQNLIADPDRYRLMNPENGWGNYFGLIATLCDFIKVASTHPYMKVVYWL